MKNSTLVIPMMFGIISVMLFACKKSAEIEILTKTAETSLNQKFPTLENLTKVEFDKLTALLSDSKGKRETALAYANELAKKRRLPTSSAVSMANKKLANSFYSEDEDVVDETESTTSESAYIYSEYMWDSYDGSESTNDHWTNMSVDVPKFTFKHRRGVTLPGRNTVMEIEVPIQCRFAFSQTTSKSYWKINTEYLPKKPKLYLSGVLGELHVEYEDITIGGYGPYEGDYIGEADVRIRENRSIVHLSNGTSSLETNVGGFSAGGTNSNGQTITQVRNVQGFFTYHSDFLVFGTNTGYSGSLGQYYNQLYYPNIPNEAYYNLWILQPPTTGFSDNFKFVGINRN